MNLNRLNLYFKTTRILYSLSCALWQKRERDSETLDWTCSSGTMREFHHLSLHPTSSPSCGELGLMLTVESNVLAYIISVGPHYDPMK